MEPSLYLKGLWI